MKWIGFFLFVMILSISAEGQQVPISGLVAGEKGEPIQSASVVLLTKKDMKPFAHTVSDEKGNFRLDAVKGEAYVLKISRVGYELFDQEFPSFTEADMGRILLKIQSDSLQSVTVTGNHPLITRKADRMVLNVENNPLAAGKSAMELFRLAPGVFVQNEDIVINGITSAQVMVNGRLLRMSGKELSDYLSTLRSEEIASIEIIPNPPAEYDASAGGLINIVYKKQRKDGMNGSLSSSYDQGRYASFGENMQLNYKENKLTLSGGYGRNWNKGYGTSWTSRTSDDIDYKYQYSGFRKDVADGDRVRAGAIYDINSKQYMGIDYSHSGWDQNSPYQTTTLIGNTGAKDVSLFGVFPRITNAAYNNLGYNYTARLDSTGTTLTLLTDYSWNHSVNTNSAVTNYYAEGVGTVLDTSYRNIINGTSHVYTADLKLDKPFKNYSGISLGGKMVRATIDNAVNFQDLSNAQWVNDHSQSYLYDYKENIYAGFLSYYGKVFKTDVKLGLRAEYTTTDGNLLMTGSAQDNKNSYLGLFPSLFLLKKLNEEAGNEISLNARRGIDRPGYTQLNPYVIYIDNYTTSQGNPYLKPQYSNQFNLQYTWHHDYSVCVIYQRANGVIFNILHTKPGDSLTTYYAPQNLDNRDDYVVILSAPLKVSRWLTMNNNFVFKQERMSSGDIQYNHPTIYLDNNLDVSLPKNYRLSAASSYVSSFMVGNIASKGYYRLDMGVQKTFLKDKLMARFNVNDVFNSEKLRTTVNYQQYIQLGLEKNQTQSFVFQLIYNFNLGKAFTTKQMDRSNEDERNRLGVK
jgi:iron complex outermembrane recepter protein